MAIYQSSSKCHIIVLLLVTICFFGSERVSSFEFQVGGNNGWVVPPKNDTKKYNDWASENRFTVGDALHFRYKKDSVMEVTETEYKNCNSTHPHFFSNTGNTEFNLDRSGAFYFISGAAGHCDRGQRMIVKVISDDDSQSNGASVGRGSLGGFAAAMLIAVLANGIVAPFALSHFI